MVDYKLLPVVILPPGGGGAGVPLGGGPAGGGPPGGGDTVGVTANSSIKETLIM